MPTGCGGIDDSAHVAEYRRQGWWTGERLTDRFERLVQADHGRMAVVDDRGVALTRGELWISAGELGDTFADAGVRRGDAVIIYAPNTTEWQRAFLAVLRLGAVPATVPVTTDADTLAYVYELIGARAIIAPESHRGRPTGQWARQAATSTGCRGAVVIDHGGSAPRIEHLAGRDAGPLLPSGVDHLMFTSSTTGRPKAVMHTSDTLGAANIAFANRFGIDETTPIFMPSPLGHSVGAWHGARLSLFAGAPLVLQNSWDPVRALHLVMTEGTGTTCTAESTPEQLSRTAGRPVPNLELRINDPDASGAGELLMRGAGVFVGYFGQEEMYRGLLTEDGWFHTGDLARVDADGYLRLTGRLKDMIIRGGVNISPVPIEDMIAAHPAVRRVAVIGQADERLGERICAVIVPAETPPTLEQMITWLRAQGLSERLLPEALVVVDDMPVTAAGKIRKLDLRHLVEANQ